MSEIYRNTSQYVHLDITGGTADGTPVAMVGDSTTPVNGPVALPNDVQRWTATLNISKTQNVGSLKVVWTFAIDGEPVTKTDNFTVTVPLISLNDMRTELELGPDVTNTALVQAERRVRKIIESYCGQRFEPTNEVLITHGNGDKILKMPKRSLEVTSMTDTRYAVPWVGFQVVQDGWGLKRTDGYYYDIYTSTAPIYAPSVNGIGGHWPANVEWAIAGRWGWDAVPNEVQEAAIVLLEQRLCSQANYRDNYISRMRASDWQFDFFQEANSGTGNVVADQLLSDFIVVRGALI